MSIGIWFNPGPGVDGLAVIVARSVEGEAEADNAAFFFDVQAGIDVRYIHEYGSGSNEANTFNTNLSQGVWRYIGVSRDATAKTVKMWIGDGETLTLIDTYTYTNAPTGGTHASASLRLFGVAGTANKALEDASLAKFTLHDKPLTLGEHYAQMLGRPPLENLIIWSPLGESSPEPDWSGNGYIGTLSGTSTVVAGPPTATPFIGQFIGTFADPNITVAVPAGSLTLTGKTPIASLGPFTIPVGLGSLVLTGQSPSAVINNPLEVPVGSLVLTGKTPAVFQVVPVQPGAGALALAAFAPVANVMVEPLVCSTVTANAAVKAMEWKDEPTEVLGT